MTDELTQEFLKTVEDWHVDHHEWRSDPGWFHPSSLGNPCDAYLAFEYLGIEKRGSQKPRNLRILHNGDGRDNAWKWYLKKSGLSVIGREGFRRNRQVILSDLRIRGEFDDLVLLSDGQLCLVEFKTMNNDEWENLKDPKPEHWLQVHPYMWGTNTPRTMFMYENKNNQHVKLFLRQFDRALWDEKIVGRISRILSLLQQMELPMRTPAQYEKSCPFFWTCSKFQF